MFDCLDYCSYSNANIASFGKCRGHSYAGTISYLCHVVFHTYSSFTRVNITPRPYSLNGTTWVCLLFYTLSKAFITLLCLFPSISPQVVLLTIILHLLGRLKYHIVGSKSMTNPEYHLRTIVSEAKVSSYLPYL